MPEEIKPRLQTKTWAIVKWQFEGLHYYAGAENEEKFLQHPHRHMFHCEAQVEQFHNDRDVEYIWLKRELQKWFGVFRQGRFSCEMIAEEIWRHLNTLLPGRGYKVRVTEDGENGAMIE